MTTSRPLALGLALSGALLGFVGLHACAPSPSSRAPCDVEVCGDEVDNDCDGQIDEEDAVDRIVWFVDGDRDGYGNPTIYIEACLRPIGHVEAGGDCDDGNSNVHPDAEEICDGLDNDCDGRTDQEDATGAKTFYADGDEDGYGDAAAPLAQCERPRGYVSDATDCDDTRDDVHPLNSEYCDEIDNDCDGLIDEEGAVDPPTWYLDADEDGYGDPDLSIAQCDAPAGYVADGRDCNDADASINRDADELCDGVDNDCDDRIDEDDVIDALDCRPDLDDDGFGDERAPATRLCECPVGTVDDASDCDDTNDAVHPEAAEACLDEVDNDCDGAIDVKDADCP
jgi:hypothetical protein